MGFVVLVALALLSTMASAFPWTNGEPRQYARGEGVEVHVQPLAGGFGAPRGSLARPLDSSYGNPVFTGFGQRPSKAVATPPINYYNLHSCRPAELAGAGHATPSRMSMLFGTQTQRAPYDVRVMVEERTKTACGTDGFAPDLTALEAQDLRTRIDQGYTVRLELEGLPITTYDLQLDPEGVRRGFPLGYAAGGKHFINNHLMMLVLVHRVGGEHLLSDSPGAQAAASNMSTPSTFGVVGFMVVACSIHRKPGRRLDGSLFCPVSPDEPDAPKPQEVAEGAQIAYTYDVYWEESDITWEHRWDGYVRLPPTMERIRWLSALISGVAAVGLGVVATLMVSRAAQERFACYDLLGVKQDPFKHVAAELTDAVNGTAVKNGVPWRLICGLGGFWTIIVVTAGAVIVIPAVGSFWPDIRGKLLSVTLAAPILVAYVLTLAPAGFIAMHFCGEGIRGKFSRTGLHMMVLPLGQLVPIDVITSNRLHDGLPRRLCDVVSAVSVLTSASHTLWCSGVLLDSFSAAAAPATSAKLDPHDDAADRWRRVTRSALRYVASSTLPFAACAVECFVALTCIWQGYVYSISAPALLTASLTVMISVEVSVICACTELPTHDNRWWLRTFQRIVSPAISFLLFSLAFLSIQLRPATLPDAAYFLLCMLRLTAGACGVVAIGFLLTFVLQSKIERLFSAKEVASAKGVPACAEAPARQSLLVDR